MSTSQHNEFKGWLKRNNLNPDLTELDVQATEAIAKIGINGESVLNESDFSKLRLLASELSIKRDECGIKDIEVFIGIISYIHAYADYLEACVDSKQVVDNECDVSELTTDSLTVAYYLSRVNTNALKKLGYKSFREAFGKIGVILSQKPSTIKNMRDEFDPYFDNGRVGWYQRDLSPSRQRIFDRYKDVSDMELEKKVKNILQNHEDRKTKNRKSESHTRIVIASKGMKEIKTKK